MFKKSVVDEECVRNVLETVVARITEKEQQMCDGDIQIEEIMTAIKQSQPNKSPGSDGLTSEFYKTFANILAPILLKVYTWLEEKKEVPESIVTGIITVLYKNKGSQLKLENFRPLTLLNTDYKILTIFFSNRIKTVLGTIISPTQAYSVPGREITDTICTIRDVVDRMKDIDEGGILLNIDLNKAFDRVEHSFLYKTMERFGFGHRVISWIKLLYSNAKSRVKVNGVLTDSFPLERSVRQGCPLSAILYSVRTTGIFSQNR